MASIFTFEPDIPRLSSPWTKHLDDQDDLLPQADVEASGKATPELARRIIKLDPEPQEGPVEYKLHLLLRPRRSFSHLESLLEVAKDERSKHSGRSPAVVSDHLSQLTTPSAGPLTAQARQHRLEQLTTQLLWRLQQSSPHHASSASNTIIPVFPEALPELQTPLQPARLLHGLEESQGALYEIGVSDDGSFVGIAEDEMHESLNNLRAMAACMGCLLYTSPSPRDRTRSRMPSSA